MLGSATVVGNVVLLGAEDFRVYTLSLRQGRLSVAFCTYPPALVIVQADGSIVCPMLWGTTGKVRREPGWPVSALLLSQFGNESVAKRVEGTVEAGGSAVH